MFYSFLLLKVTISCGIKNYKFDLLGGACSLRYVLKRCADFINMKDVLHIYCISVLYQSASNMQKQNIKMNIY